MHKHAAMTSTMLILLVSKPCKNVAPCGFNGTTTIASKKEILSYRLRIECEDVFIQFGRMND